MPMLMTLRMRLPVCPFHCAAADAIREVRHLVEDCVDLGHDVLSVHQDGCAFGRAQGHVQDGALLREVNFAPRNIASICDRRPDSSASWMRSLTVSSVMRFLE